MLHFKRNDMSFSSDCSSWDTGLPSENIEDIDSTLFHLTKQVPKLKNDTRVKLEATLVFAKMKREKLRAAVAVARSQCLGAEMKLLAEANALRKELAEMLEVVEELVNDSCGKNSSVGNVGKPYKNEKDAKRRYNRGTDTSSDEEIAETRPDTSTPAKAPHRFDLVPESPDILSLSSQNAIKSLKEQ